VRLPSSLDVLRERNFARYLAAESISVLGSGMAMVALAFAVLEFGGATELGVVLLAREIPTVAFLLLGGVFADRRSRRTILIGSDILGGTAQVVTAILLFSGNANLWNIALLQIVFGVASAFSGPAETGFVKEAVSDARLQEANALLGLSKSVFFIAGPAIGALIVTAGSPAWAMAADAVTFFMSAMLIASMRLTSIVRLGSTPILGDLRSGWREFVGRPWAVAMIVSFGLFQVTFFPALLVLGPLVAKEELGGAGAWGTILALQSVGAVLGGIYALRLKVKRPLVVCQLLVIPAGLTLAALAVPLPLVGIAAFSLALGIGFALGNTLWMTTLQRNVPDQTLSRISSFDWFGSVALNPIGYALIGPIAATIGRSETLIIAAVLNLAVCLSVVLVPSVRNIRMAAPATVGPLPNSGG
jgi:MFS family permease